LLEMAASGVDCPKARNGINKINIRIHPMRCFVKRFVIR
jgi:hypothetical protein